MNSFERLSVISVFCLAATGCATTQALHAKNPCNEGQGIQLLFGFLSTNNSKINKSCSEDQAIQMLVESNDPGLQAVGARAMIKKYGAEEAAARVGASLVKAAGPKDCEVLEVKQQEDGSKRIKLGNCKTVGDMSAPSPSQ